MQVTSAIGKYVGSKEDKSVVIHGSNGNIRLNLLEDCFSIFDAQGNQQETGKLEQRHVESFLEAVLSQQDPMSAPGVLDFDAALRILEILDQTKNKITTMPEYQANEPVSAILEGFHQKAIVGPSQANLRTKSPL